MWDAARNNGITASPTASANRRQLIILTRGVVITSYHDELPSHAQGIQGINLDGDEGPLHKLLYRNYYKEIGQTTSKSVSSNFNKRGIANALK